MSSSAEIGRGFNLDEANKDPGGGIIYAARYTPELLRAKQDQLLDCFHDQGFSFVHLRSGGIGITAPDEQTLNQVGDSMMLLAEELTVVNEGIEYQSSGVGVNQSTVTGAVFDIKRIVDSTLMQVAGGTCEEEHAFQIATVFVPIVTNDLMTSHLQNDTLTKSDLEAIELLRESADLLARVANGHTVLIDIADYPFDAS